MSKRKKKKSVHLLRRNEWLCVVPQGPAGKDGLPGHPGQRGETVSGRLKSNRLPLSSDKSHVNWFSSSRRDSKERRALPVPRAWSDLR